MRNQPAREKHISICAGSCVATIAESPTATILLAHVIAANPHTPLPKVSSVGTTAIFFTARRAPQGQGKVLCGIVARHEGREGVFEHPSPGVRYSEPRGCLRCKTPSPG